MPGKDAGNSIKCPDIYEALKRQGYSKEKAARISNAMCKKRKAEDVDLSNDELSAALKELRKVWKADNPGKGDSDMPDYLTMSEPTRRFADENELPDSCFAIVDDQGRSVPLCNDSGEFDADKVDAAIASFMDKGANDDGDDSATLPDDVRNTAVARIKRAWRRANPDKDESDMPKISREDGANFASDEPVAMKDETRSADYLAKMWEWLQEKFSGKVSEEEFREAHAKARGYAGGKAKARKRSETVDAAELHAHYATHEGEESCTFCYDMPYANVLKMAKADDRADYRASTDDTVKCFHCRFYQWGACQLVEGSIEADDVCNLWTAPVQTIPAQNEDRAVSIYSAASETSGRHLFNELPAAFADAPEWINVLPVPGKYAHPTYGMILIDEERNRNFVNNFDAGIYNQSLPITIDIEHDSKMSGAMGYFEELRVNADGSVDAKVEWNETGKTLIEGEQFRYFSPEWWDTWVHPVTKVTYNDVLIGGALTVRPYFKEDVLRPLVASEGALVAPLGAGKDPAETIVLRRVESRGGITVGMIQMSEERVAELEAAATRLAEVEAAKVAAETAANEAAERATGLETRIAAIESERRRQRFSELVAGRGGDTDGAAWVGAIDDNVSVLETLANQFGEDSETFTKFVAAQKAQAKAYAESGLFAPAGTSESDGGATAWDRMQSAAKKYSEENGVPLAVAIDAIGKANPELAAEVNEEMLYG